MFPAVLGTVVLLGAAVGFVSVHDEGSNLRAGSSLPSGAAQTPPATSASASFSATVTDADESGYFTCPPGDYLGHTDADKAVRNARLQKLQVRVR